MDVQFYNKDAREEFLEPNSVDLFLVHPPFMYTPKRYGGDPAVQLHNTESEDEYYSSFIQCIKNMGKALSEDGNILLLLPNVDNSFNIISKIVNDTDLIIMKSLFWTYERDYHLKNDSRQTNFVLQIRKNKDFKYPIEGLNSLVIDIPWNVMDLDLHAYHNQGMSVGDAFPLALSDFLIPLFSKEGDVVADIFAGTGTTLISALKNNRKAIYNDSSIDQHNLAKDRISNLTNKKEIGEKMIGQEVVDFMVESMMETTRLLYERSNMTPDQIKQYEEQNKMSMTIIASSLYQKMQEKNLLA